MNPTTGYTRLPTARERLRNEIVSLTVLIAEHPSVEYYAERYSHAMAQKHTDDLRDNQRACDTTGCFGTATGDRAICLDCWIDELERELDYCDLLDTQEGLRHG
jgi:hypothetical protein